MSQYAQGNSLIEIEIAGKIVKINNGFLSLPESMRKETVVKVVALMEADPQLNQDLRKDPEFVVTASEVVTVPEFVAKENAERAQRHWASAEGRAIRERLISGVSNRFLYCVASFGLDYCRGIWRIAAARASCAFPCLGAIIQHFTATGCTMLARTQSPRDPRVLSLCREMRIRIVRPNTFPMPGQTRATATIGRLLARFGPGHTRLVLLVLSECRDRNLPVGDLWPDTGMPRYRRGQPRGHARSARPRSASVRGRQRTARRDRPSTALAALIYLHMRLLRPEPLTAKDAAYLVMRKARTSEAAKGRCMPSPR